MEEAKVEFSHAMSITRIYESPRVTQPYSEEQWAEVLALGEKVDLQLKEGDVRLTMGGEPTFVATENRDAAEWNTDALGPSKRGLATDLVHKLRRQYGLGGFLHFGQGKWYPGEQLPRWALSIYWRADGRACWQNPELFADESLSKNYAPEDAKNFLINLAHRLGVQTDNILPGHEDTWYYLWRERRLPINVDPFDSRLDDELERARLHRVFSHGLDQEIGYVLPLAAVDTHDASNSLTQWQSGKWFVRDERLYLMPGDSAMGWRLPLDSLPWSAPNDKQVLIDQDPYASRSPLQTTLQSSRVSTSPVMQSRSNASAKSPVKCRLISSIGTT